MLQEKVNLKCRTALFTLVLVTNFSLFAQEKPVQPETEEVEIEETIVVEENLELEEQSEVPFHVVESVPHPTVCEGESTNDDKKRCVIEFIQKHVARNFDLNMTSQLDIPSGLKRIFVQFRIDQSGKIIDVKARAPHVKLEIEAKRVIRALPQFIPGKERGENVVVPYTLPITFEVAGSTEKTTSPEPLEPIDVYSEDVEIVEVEAVEAVEEENPNVPFAIIENPPHPSKCAIKKTSREKKMCTSQYVNKHVAKKFNTDLATELGLPPGKKRILTIFKIDKTGKVTNITARGPHPDLEAEAVRVIGLLPDFIPGKQKGKAVIVPFSMPIVFTVADRTENRKKKRRRN
ncbi:MAG: hypothetical protein Wins2KO_07920 [Winogradskyella sp.]